MELCLPASHKHLLTEAYYEQANMLAQVSQVIIANYKQPEIANFSATSIMTLTQKPEPNIRSLPNLSKAANAMLAQTDLQLVPSFVILAQQTLAARPWWTN